MSFDFQSRRFDPRWLSPATEKYAEENSARLDAFLRSAYKDLKKDAEEQELDVPIEQIASQGLCVCPLCGATVTKDGTVVSEGPLRAPSGFEQGASQ